MCTSCMVCDEGGVLCYLWRISFGCVPELRESRLPGLARQAKIKGEQGRQANQ